MPKDWNLYVDIEGVWYISLYKANYGLEMYEITEDVALNIIGEFDEEADELPF